MGGLKVGLRIARGDARKQGRLGADFPDYQAPLSSLWGHRGLGPPNSEPAGETEFFSWHLR